MSKVEEIKEALLAGELLTAREVAEKFRCHPTTLTNAVKQLKREGYKVTERKVQGLKRTEKQISVNAGQQNVRSGRDDIASSRELQTNSSATDIPFPTFGSDLKVVGINADRKGEVSVIMRNGKYAWKMIVEGATAK